MSAPTIPAATTTFPTWIDGRLLAPGLARISTDDAGFQLGLAVFETLLYEDECLYDVAAHLARLEESARTIGIAWPLAWDVARVLDEYVRALESRSAAIRVTLTRGAPSLAPSLVPSLVIGARAIVRPSDPGVVVVVAHEACVEPGPLAGVKSTNRLGYVLAREAAQRAGAFDALLCGAGNEVVEGTISNVFALVDGVVVTPGRERGCLAGTMRAAILDELARAGRPVAIGRLTLSDLSRASEAFLSNTTGRVIPIVEVGGVVRSLPGSAGALVQDLRARLAARAAAYRQSARGAARDSG